VCRKITDSWVRSALRLDHPCACWTSDMKLHARAWMPVSVRTVLCSNRLGPSEARLMAFRFQTITQKIRLTSLPFRSKHTFSS
jgi:hypothetical protein